MTKEEYARLQRLLQDKKKKAHKEHYPSNYGHGWEDAIDCVRSILSRQFKPVEENEKK